MTTDEYYEEGAESSGNKIKACSSIKKSDYMMIDGCPCKVMDVTTTKTGKHGHAKATIIGINIFNGKKAIFAGPVSHCVEVPTVEKKDYMVIYLEDEDESLKERRVTILEEGSSEDPLSGFILPEEFSDGKTLSQFLKDYQDEKPLVVTVMKACGQEKIISYKEDLKSRYDN